MKDRSEIWNLLAQRGLVRGEAPQAKPGTPWFVKILIAFSGWLAAIFIFAFFGAVFVSVFDQAATAAILGCLLVSGAYFLLRLSKSDFFEHAGLAVSLAGQGLWLIAIADAFDGSQAAWLLAAVLEAALLWLMPNFIHRVFSAFTAAVFCSIGAAMSGFPYVIGGVVLILAVWLWCHEFTWPKHRQLIAAAGYGLVLAALCTQGIKQDGNLKWILGSWDRPVWTAPWMGEAIHSAALLYLVGLVLTRHSAKMTSVSSLALFGAALLVAVVSAEIHGLTLGMTILLLGFAIGNPVIMGFGAIGLLGFVSSYYYYLETTLLQKSLQLLIFGLVLFALRWLSHLGIFTRESAHDK